ncbi:unnamed protein product [Rhizoctonia solani]|uniref:Fungal-type protein kinase domain-containing protein n=1 Tax=Rhizoctonia solani TaxID=456999 RepID=A0A8H2W9D3_9AGAM|nr:unnamed protein product [Rhizoctonia solani]
MTPSRRETVKRKTEDGTELVGAAKKVKTSTLDPADTSPIETTTQAIDETDDPSVVLPGAITGLSTPTTSGSSTEALPVNIQRPSITTPTTPQPLPSRQPVAGVFNTSIKLSSSNIDTSCIAPSESSSYRSGLGSKAADTQQTQQATKSNEITKAEIHQIEELLRHELRGAVYQHKRFFDEFFRLPKQELVFNPQARVLRKVLDQARQPKRSLGQDNHIDYDSINQQWTLHKAITDQNDEKTVYKPLAKALNVVGQAAFEVYWEEYPKDTIRKDYFRFIDHSTRPTRHDLPSDGEAKPDLVQGSVHDNRVHWADVELVTECKSKFGNGHRNEAYMQLARYARATFAHQIYRVRVFGFSLCGSIVNFVCFDRSGMLHSPDIDLSKPEGAHDFIQHIITLLTLDARRIGYDDRYSFDYSSNPPRTLFKFGNDPPKLVSEILCYRKCACGRATCVTCLGENVHKSTWRPEDRPDEGKTMSGFANVFGFCQLTGHSDTEYNTRLQYPDQLEWSEATTYFIPHSRRFDDLTLEQGPISRGIRIKSDIIMQRGTSLFKAQNPYHLVMAIHDGLLAIMALTEVGKLHCDISAYNLLLVDADKHYPDQKWLGQSSFDAKPEVWQRNARRLFIGGDEGSKDEDQDTSHYESPRLDRVKKLARGPFCVLHDTEFTVDDDPNSKNVHADLTGTPAFISVQLLDTDKRVFRTFMHDVESLFWVMLWSLVCRSQDKNTWKVNGHAENQIRGLSNSSMTGLLQFKKSLLHSVVTGGGKDFAETIMKLDNSWCEDLFPILRQFGFFLYYYLYDSPPKALLDSADPLEKAIYDASLGQHLLHNEYLNQPHLKTFEILFAMFDRHINTLKEKYHEVDLTQL